MYTHFNGPFLHSRCGNRRPGHGGAPCRRGGAGTYGGAGMLASYYESLSPPAPHRRGRAARTSLSMAATTAIVSGALAILAVTAGAAAATTGFGAKPHILFVVVDDRECHCSPSSAGALGISAASSCAPAST